LKRLVSIFFLIVFLFNVGGYYIVFWGIQNQASKNLLKRLDADDFSKEDLVVLTIPLTLPYPISANDGGYERIDGEFRHDGEYYKLIKQKLENDTLFIVCYRDRDATRIASALTDYSNVANSVPAGTKHAQNFISKIYKDYNTTEFTIHYKSRLLYEQVYLASSDLFFDGRAVPVDSPPPKSNS
jgi:hypothetical protein